MLSEIREFVKNYQDDIILVVGVILISLLSFAAGFITAELQGKEPIKIEKIQNRHTAYNNFRDEIAIERLSRGRFNYYEKCSMSFRHHS